MNTVENRDQARSTPAGRAADRGPVQRDGDAYSYGRTTARSVSSGARRLPRPVRERERDAAVRERSPVRHRNTTEAFAIFGSSGVLTLALGRVLHMWNQAMKLFTDGEP